MSQCLGHKSGMLQTWVQVLVMQKSFPMFLSKSLIIKPRKCIRRGKAGKKYSELLSLKFQSYI